MGALQLEKHDGVRADAFHGVEHHAEPRGSLPQNLAALEMTGRNHAKEMRQVSSAEHGLKPAKGVPVLQNLRPLRERVPGSGSLVPRGG